LASVTDAVNRLPADSPRVNGDKVARSSRTRRETCLGFELA
jgi:hypothetical protein